MGGHVANTGEVRNVYSILIKKNLKERDHLGDLGVDEKIMAYDGSCRNRI
jgi:hypothetical protein